MNSFGIYFGEKSLSFAECKGRKMVNNLYVDRTVLTGEGGAEKVPDDLKIVALLKDHLRRYKINATEAAISLSSRDLIVRTFDIPLMPPDELRSAIAFEAKKYVPFKMEELVSDYQVSIDRFNKKNQVVFVGIKKDMLAKYVSIIAQLGLKVSTLEYFGFSLLRFAGLAGVPTKGIVAMVAVGGSKEGETNFSVLENGFPLFTRDIVLGMDAPVVAADAVAEAVPAPAAAGSNSMLAEKLKTELRVSFDFYNRKFSGKRVTTVFALCPDEMRSELDSFSREMGIPIQFIDPSKVLGVGVPYALGQFSSYSASLSKTVKGSVAINLLAPKVNLLASKKLDMNVNMDINSVISGFIFDPKSIVFGLLICAGVYGFGQYRMAPVQEELKKVKAQRPEFSKLSGDSTLPQLNAMKDEYEKKLKVLDGLIRNQMMITAPLSAIPALLPEGLWLTNFNYSSTEAGTMELTFSGVAYLDNSEQEMLKVNEFLGNLNSDDAFAKSFSDIRLVSMNRDETKGAKVTTFSIRCNKTRKR